MLGLMILMGLAFLFTLPCFWLFVSDKVHKFNQKKEQKEIQTEHEEEMLKGIQFSQLWEAEERLQSTGSGRSQVGSAFFVFINH